MALSDNALERMASLIIGRPDQKGSTGRDNRMFVEAVLWIVRRGSPFQACADYAPPNAGTKHLLWNASGIAFFDP